MKRELFFLANFYQGDRSVLNKKNSWKWMSSLWITEIGKKYIDMLKASRYGSRVPHIEWFILAECCCNFFLLDYRQNDRDWLKSPNSHSLSANPIFFFQTLAKENDSIFDEMDLQYGKYVFQFRHWDVVCFWNCDVFCFFLCVLIVSMCFLCILSVSQYFNALKLTLMSISGLF